MPLRNAGPEEREEATHDHKTSHAPGRDAHDRSVALGRLRADDRVPVPKPIRIGSRAVRWVEQEVLDFIASRPRAGSDRPACAAGMIRDLLDRQRRKPAMSKGEEMLAAGLAALPSNRLLPAAPGGCQVHQRPSSRGLCVPLPDWLLVSVAAHSAATPRRAQRARFLPPPRRAEGRATGSPPPGAPARVVS